MADRDITLNIRMRSDAKQAQRDLDAVGAAAEKAAGRTKKAKKELSPHEMEVEAVSGMIKNRIVDRYQDLQEEVARNLGKRDSLVFDALLGVPRMDRNIRKLEKYLEDRLLRLQSSLVRGRHGTGVLEGLTNVGIAYEQAIVQSSELFEKSMRGVGNSLSGAGRGFVEMMFGLQLIAKRGSGLEELVHSLMMLHAAFMALSGSWRVLTNIASGVRFSEHAFASWSFMKRAASKVAGLDVPGIAAGRVKYAAALPSLDEMLGYNGGLVQAGQGTGSGQVQSIAPTAAPAGYLLAGMARRMGAETEKKAAAQEAYASLKAATGGSHLPTFALAAQEYRAREQAARYNPARYGQGVRLAAGLRDQAELNQLRQKYPSPPVASARNMFHAEQDVILASLFGQGWTSSVAGNASYAARAAITPSVGTQYALSSAARYAGYTGVGTVAGVGAGTVATGVGLALVGTAIGTAIVDAISGRSSAFSDIGSSFLDPTTKHGKQVRGWWDTLTYTGTEHTIGSVFGGKWNPLRYGPVGDIARMFSDTPLSSSGRFREGLTPEERLEMLKTKTGQRDIREEAAQQRLGIISQQENQLMALRNEQRLLSYGYQGSVRNLGLTQAHAEEIAAARRGVLNIQMEADAPNAPESLKSRARFDAAELERRASRLASEREIVMGMESLTQQLVAVEKDRATAARAIREEYDKTYKLTNEITPLLALSQKLTENDEAATRRKKTLMEEMSKLQMERMRIGERDMQKQLEFYQSEERHLRGVIAMEKERRENNLAEVGLLSNERQLQLLDVAQRIQQNIPLSEEQMSSISGVGMFNDLTRQKSLEHASTNPVLQMLQQILNQRSDRKLAESTEAHAFAKEKAITIEQNLSVNMAQNREEMTRTLQTALRPVFDLLEKYARESVKHSITAFERQQLHKAIQGIIP